MRKKASKAFSKKIAVFCSGNGSNFEAIARFAKQGKLGGEIVLMVCDKPGAYALTRAKKYAIPSVLLPTNLFPSREDYERAIVKILKNQQVDMIVLAGFMRILTPYFIKAYRGRILNIHPSLLPAFKGAHAIKDAFEAGVKETGASVHLVTPEVDGGAVLAQSRVKVTSKDDLDSLTKKIHKAEHKLYPTAIRKFVRR